MAAHDGNKFEGWRTGVIAEGDASDEEARLFRCLDICADVPECGGVSYQKRENGNPSSPDSKQGRCWFIDKDDIHISTVLNEADLRTLEGTTSPFDIENNYDIYYKYA